MKDILKHLDPEAQLRFLQNIITPQVQPDQAKRFEQIQNIMDELTTNPSVTYEGRNPTHRTMAK